MEPQRAREQVSCDVIDDVEVPGESLMSNTEPKRTAKDKLLMNES